MTPHQDKTRNDWVGYLNFHGPRLELARAKAAAALEEYGREIKACEAYERAFRPETWLDDVMTAADAPLAQEIRAHLEATTAPMLATTA